MIRFKHLTSLAAVGALGLAACGGGGSASGGGTHATVGVSSTGVGHVLADSSGHTLYLFKKDPRGASLCRGECANDWPPLLAGAKPTTGDQAKAALLGTTMRADGARQVTYAGHPLYRYEGDQKAGDANGQGVSAFGARWYALGAGGTQVTKAPEAGMGSSYGGGSGY